MADVARAPCLAVLLTFHSSLQHEILHGHPTRSAAVNRLFGILPLSLDSVRPLRALHLTHHVTPPDRSIDPESITSPEVAKRSASRAGFRGSADSPDRMLIGSW
jgi:fatty acid desaturase